MSAKISMLTTMQWVPAGAMRPVPLKSSEDKAEVKRRLAELNGEEAEGDRHALDSDDDAPEDGVMGQGQGNIIEGVESDDDEEVDDTTFKPTDLVMLTARADADPQMELYVYDEPSDNVFLHHDAHLPAFPLSVTWLTEGTMSIAAVGTMLPFIELWNLDVIDPVGPLCVLGGCERPERNYKRKVHTEWLREDSHTDAVISLQWNTTAQQILASGGADGKLKMWDLNQVACLGTYAEGGKVQSLSWSPSNGHVLLSAVDDVVSIRDCRNPTAAATRWGRNGDNVENVKWNHLDDGTTLLASTTAGHVSLYDTRRADAPIWDVVMHGSETVFDVSRHAPLLAAGGTDEQTSLWRLEAAGPVELANRKLGVGQSFAVQFHPNAAHIVGAVGKNGKPLVYTITADVDGTAQQEE